MLDISQHRSRIGSFYQDYRNKINRKNKFMKYHNECPLSHEAGKITLETMKSILKAIILLVLLTSAPPTPLSCLPPASAATASWTATLDILYCWMLPNTAHPGDCSDQHSPVVSSSGKVNFAQSYLQLHILGKKQTPNFLAKYVNGNRKKGIINLHLNIRSLKNKIAEIKHLVKEHTPHVFGLSE